jgi:ribonuclease HI
LQQLKIDPVGWDYLIVSDGSGTIATTPCGWCGVMIRRGANFERKYFHGAMNTGTNIVAEIMGLTQPLMWLSRQKGRTKPATVHIITDCQVVKDIGEGKVSRKAHKALWHYISALEREIGILKFHWMPRESTMLNRFSDRVAGQSRKLLLGEDMEKAAIEALDLEKWLKLPNADSIHDLNPS